MLSESVAYTVRVGGKRSGRQWQAGGDVILNAWLNMEKAAYEPKPLDTSNIQLSEDLIRLTELFARNAHEVWARDRISEGWRYGPNRNENLREHPSLIPYERLSESEKQLDRNAAMETVKTLISLGYRKDKADKDALVDGADLKEKADEIVHCFKNSEIKMADLRRLWEERLPIVWLRNVQIYRRAVDVAMRLGESFLAFDIAAEGLQAFKNDLRLIQLQALALARTGATRRANAILEQLRLSGHQDEETLGILARTHKDFWQLSADPEERRKHLKTSYELYLEGYKRNRGYYSGINAASMGLIYGEKDTAMQLGKEVIDLCLTILEHISPESDERYWLEATLAEAALIMKDLPMAEEYYQRGSEQRGMSTVVLSRTRSQARLLLEHITGDPHRLDHCFALPRIAVFSGHMFDRADRRNARFPHHLETEVRAEIERRLTDLKAQVGYSSLACGGDMIFAESLLARGGEVNIVLPFKKDDFKRVSVAIVEGQDWGERFEHILKNAATVTVLNELGDANDGAAYDFCNQALSGLALLKSQFLGMDVVPMAVWDGRKGDGRGGTQSFVDYWKNHRKMNVEIIALNQYLPQPAQSDTEISYMGETEILNRSAVRRANGRISQEIKAMIFADVVGYTKLSEIQIPIFVDHFLGKVAELMDSMKNPPIHRNTWGDAVCCVFNHVVDAGVFGLNLRDLVRGTDWSKWNLPELNIRIALHAGPVFECYDPVLKKKTYNGSHVNRTARIEPIAEEGQIYASEAFAALSAADDVAEFTCDYVGTKQLAKKYGAIPVFLVRRTT